MEIIENIIGYYTGADIRNYYDNEINNYKFMSNQERIDKQRELEKQRNKYSWKISLANLGYIPAFCFSGIVCPIIIGFSELYRNTCRRDFRTQKMFNRMNKAVERHGIAADSLMKTLSQPGVGEKIRSALIRNK